ncbi:uncharacterized protein si:ch211-106e7.2 [Betta splendens]|uniref:Uncharacterized protein si:ch211-106e7.2 n=1 Tax=Betta splendens TaxID=158456 RepID=A0A6P7MP33_BETSP|nr:uncharacterized protein si:ch211-106e7.2 [Betta splendens]XP_029008591.1 uncharacterized protein si:ch211-106e7.2 [Betta splendens]XP_029008592.1 uncharacterized protein si:ch211-106e7.2 [Betta splendens]XP_040927207.1 uncharacterized protein si:ch211-106e7.2 [Betta splendens]XP_055365477.1 uncharacterized protein si:ch211-106e7.2 [Betta splendens]XP_055365478.1 uncharacterized protein si:ch211-106e7.2 [Betta splendens]
MSTAQKLVMFSSYQRTDMSSAWMNGQQQQAGPESHAQQALYFMRNQHTGNTNSSCRYQTVNVGGQQAQNGWMEDGANKQVSNWQTSVAPHQAASLQQPTGGRSNGSSQHFQNLNNSPQSGNHYLSFSNGAQVANQQQFHHNSFLNSSTQTLQGFQITNAIQTQDIFYWKSPVPNRKQSCHTKDGNVVHGFQHYRGHRAQLSNVNPDPYMATENVMLHKQAAGTSLPISSTAPTGQSSHPQSPRQNIIHDRLFTTPPPDYQGATHQRKTSNSLSSSQNFYATNSNQRTQQYQSQLKTVQNAGKQPYTRVKKTYAAAGKPRRSTVLKTYRPIAPQPLLRYYTHCRFNTSRHSATPGPQRVADGLSAATTGNRSGNNSLSDRNQGGFSVDAARHLTQIAETVSPQKNDGLSNSNQGALAMDACRHLAHMAESLSPQNDAQSFVENGQQPRDVHDHLQSTTSSSSPGDSSLLTSPGRTGTRAVAVVQPLSLETFQPGIPSPSQFGECTPMDEFSSNSGKSGILPEVATTKQAAYSCKDNEVCSVNADQVRPSDRPITPSAASSRSTTVSSSNSPDPNALLKTLLTSNVTEAQHCFYLKAHKKNNTTVFKKQVHAKVPESKPLDVDETPVDLSSVPTTPWNREKLNELIEATEKSQKDIQNDAYANSTLKLLNMFWGGDSNLLLSQLKGYIAITQEVKEFFNTHVTPDSIILSQIKLGFEEELKKYHFLKDGDVYTAPPYKSSWLNVNEQLDDIDKEFGFPRSLVNGLETLKSSRQPDQEGPNDNTPAQTATKTTDDISITTKHAAVDPGDEKQTLTLTTSNESFSPHETDCAVSDEPHYSFNIKVLSPEEAKRIFQQVQRVKQQDTDVDSDPGEVKNTFLEGQVQVSDIPVIDLLLETPPKEVDCVSRALETVEVSQVPFAGECQVKKEHTSEADSADEATAPQKAEICPIESDTNFHSALKEETHVISCTLFSHSELCSEEIIDLTEDDLHFAEDLNNISYVSISDGHSSTSENEDTELILAGGSPSGNSDTSDREIEDNFSGEVGSQMSTDKEHCAQDERTSTDVTESGHSPQRPPQMNLASSPHTATLHGESGTAEHQQTGAKSSDLKSVSQTLDSKKDVPDGKSPTTKTVELLLFGSSPQEKLPGGRTKSVSFPPGKTAPKLLCVKVRSREGAFQSKDPVYHGTYSVKQRIHEEWKKSFPPINIKLKKVKKRKSKHSSSSEMCFKVDRTSWSTSSTELPDSSGITWSKNATLRSLSNEGKTTGKAVKRGRPPGKKRGKEVEGKSSCPHRKKFWVSPKSFLWSG